MILEIVLIGVTTLLFYMYWKQNFSDYGKKFNQFKGPRFWPIIGNALDMQVTSEKLFDLFRESAIEQGESYRVWSAHIGMINIIRAEDAEILLSSNKHIEKSLIYEFLHGWLGTGLLTSTGSKWQHRRKLLTPAFHFNILQKFVETFGDHAQKLVEDLRKECNQTKTNLTPYITHTTLQVICETAMGTTIDAKNKIQKKYLQSIYDMATIIIKRITSPWLYSDFIFNMTPMGGKYQKFAKTLHDFTSSVIKAREANFKDSDVANLDKNTDEDGIKKKKLAMLDLLLSAKIHKQAIDDDGIREEVDTFMFEGHDTTSVGISLALLQLSHHKDVQEKIFLELDAIFGNSNRPATYDDLQNMAYLEMCLKECLRIFPSVPIMARKIREDLKLSKFTAPAGAILNIQIIDLHRDPKVFPDPLKFDPDRFLPENVKGRHPYAFIPFSAGPRNCIGQKFAMLEMKSIISAIFRNYQLEPVDAPEDVKFIVDFVLRSSKEINVKFKPRNK